MRYASLRRPQLSTLVILPPRSVMICSIWELSLERSSSAVFGAAMNAISYVRNANPPYGCCRNSPAPYCRRVRSDEEDKGTRGVGDTGKDFLLVSSSPCILAFQLYFDIALTMPIVKTSSRS